MIYHDRVVVRLDGGSDSNGDPLPSPGDTGPHPAEVQPVSTTEAFEFASNVVVTTYRVFLGPRVAVSARDKIVWRGKVCDVQGDVEPHIVRGRLHHQELVVRDVNG